MARRFHNDNTSVICPRNKRFQSIFVCAVNCRNKCSVYKTNVNIKALLDFVQNHPDYVIAGEIMATKKVEPTKNEKLFWVVDKDNHFKEVTEKELMENPLEYLQKQIWDRPPNEYELVISLKKKK